MYVKASVGCGDGGCWVGYWVGSGTQGGQFPTRSAQQWLSKCLNCNPGKMLKLDLEHKYTNFPSKYISCASFCTFFMYLCALPVFLHCAHVYLLFGEQTAEPNIGSGFFYLRPPNHFQGFFMVRLFTLNSLPFAGHLSAWFSLLRMYDAKGHIWLLLLVLFISRQLHTELQPLVPMSENVNIPPVWQTWGRSN